jgi:hypothetical protein
VVTYAQVVPTSTQAEVRNDEAAVTNAKAVVTNVKAMIKIALSSFTPRALDAPHGR